MDAPQLRRVSYADHARIAADGAVHDGPGTAARAAVEATRLEPLQKIQVAFDQLHSAATARLRGEPWDHSATFAAHTADVLAHAGRHAQTLAVAAAAAKSMIEDMTSQLKQTEDPMADEHPKPTADDPPHPLEAGGYDAGSDPQLPSNVSDVEALKEGKTTRKQSEAIARADADAAGAEEDEEVDEADAKPDAKAKEPAKAPILTPGRQQSPPSKPDRR